MNNNFKCTECENEFFISSYTINVKGEYKVKNKLIQCLECKSEVIEPIECKPDYSSIGFGKFGSMSDEDKKKVIRKRSKLSSDEKDRTNDLNKRFTGSLKKMKW